MYSYAQQQQQQQQQQQHNNNNDNKRHGGLGRQYLSNSRFYYNMQANVAAYIYTETV